MSTNSKPLVVIALGPSGSGKGTQIKFLLDRYGLNYISSGELLRERKKRDDFTGNKVASQIDQGKLVNTPVIFKMWMDKLEEFKNNPDLKGLAFEGSPRRMIEAEMLEDALDWYEWKDNRYVFYIKISREESMRRLLRRADLEGRKDDSREAIESRLDWFEDEVLPVVDFYRSQNKLIEIDGEQSVDEVAEDISKYLP